jgi:hypothetical protein
MYWANAMAHSSSNSLASTWMVMSPSPGTTFNARPLALAASAMAGRTASSVRGSSGTPTVTGRSPQRPIP